MGQIRLLTSISTAEMKLQKKYDNLLKIHHVPVLGHHIILCFLQKYIKVEKFHEKKRNFIKCAADDIGKKLHFHWKEIHFVTYLMMFFHLASCGIFTFLNAPYIHLVAFTHASLEKFFFHVLNLRIYTRCAYEILFVLNFILTFGNNFFISRRIFFKNMLSCRK